MRYNGIKFTLHTCIIYRGEQDVSGTSVVMCLTKCIHTQDDDKDHDEPLYDEVLDTIDSVKTHPQVTKGTHSPINNRTHPTFKMQTHLPTHTNSAGDGSTCTYSMSDNGAYHTTCTGRTRLVHAVANSHVSISAIVYTMDKNVAYSTPAKSQQNNIYETDYSTVELRPNVAYDVGRSYLL